MPSDGLSRREMTGKNVKSAGSRSVQRRALRRHVCKYHGEITNDLFMIFVSYGSLQYLITKPVVLIIGT